MSTAEQQQIAPVDVSRQSGMSDPKIQKQTSGSNPNGPQTQLDSSVYNTQDLRFPKEIAINAANRHWIRFTPTIQQAGSYKTSFGDGGASQINQNRVMNGTMSGGTQLSAYSAVTGLAGLNTAEGILAADTSSGVLGAAKNTVQAFDPTLSPSDRFAAGEKLAAQALQGTALAAITGAIVSGINLTRKTRRAASYISLYMPDTVNLTVVNDYDQASLTQALGKAGLAAMAGTSIKDQLLAGKGIGGSPATAEIVGALGEQTGVFGNGITDFLLFSSGLAQNPQVELLFKTTQNREFLFDFKFVPKSPEESSTIQNIIKTFRFHAAPEIPKNSGARYFVPPDEFDIEFMYGSGPNKYLPKISTCVLQGIDVNYGSAGQWTTFWSGAPVEVSVQLRFKETEIMHKALIQQGY